MEKTLYFTSPNQPNFIEVSNPTNTKQTYKVYFTGANLSIFKLEGVSISNYPNFENSFEIAVGANSTVSLELYPSCGCSTIDTFVYCRIDLENGNFTQSYKLSLSLRSDDVTKDLEKYRPFPKKFTEYQKGDYDTFALLQTNPLLTGNVKIRVNSQGATFISLIDGQFITNSPLLFNRRVGINSDYTHELYKLYLELNTNTTDFYSYVTTDTGDNISNKPLSYQIQDFYSAGAKNIKQTNDDFSMFAPLYINNKIPKYFIIFKRSKVNGLDKQELFKDLQIVKTFDLVNSELGTFLKNTITQPNFQREHIKTVTKNGSVLLEVTGNDLKSSVISTIYEDITTQIQTERNVIDFEKQIMDIYQRRGLTSHRILNLEFLFNDYEALDYDINSYFGMYVDDLSLDTFKLKNENNNLNIDCFSYPKTDILTPNKNILLNKTFLNTGDRLFYLKNKNDFYNILSYDNDNLKIDKKINFCDWKCEEDNIPIEDICLEYNPFVHFSFSNEHTLDGFILTINSRGMVYNVVITSDLQGYEDVPSEIENVKGVDVLDGFLVLNTYEYFNDYKNIKLYNVDNELIGEYPLAFSYNDGNKTFIKFSSSIDITDVAFVGYSNKTTKTIIVPIQPSMEQTLLLMAILINESIPFKTKVIGRDVYLVSTFKNIFDVEIDLKKSLVNPSDLSLFGVLNDPIVLNVDNVEYKPNYIRINSTKPLLKNEVVVYVDNFKAKQIDKDYRYTTSSNDYSILDFEGRYTLTFNGQNIIKLNDDYLKKEIFKPCDIELGIFSFYELKKFNVERFKAVYDYIKNEYSKQYRTFFSGEPLLSRMIYTIENWGSLSIKVDVEVGISGTSKFEIVRTFYIGRGQSQIFSTMVSDYNRSYYEDVEFRVYVTANGEPNDHYFIYPNSVIQDYDFININPQFPLMSFIDNKVLERYSELLKNNDPRYIFTKWSDSEYDRLNEYADGYEITDVLNPKYLKWESWESKDSKNEPMRLNYSFVFGEYNYTSDFSDFLPDINKHSHEWFVLEEFPNNQSVLEGTQNLYGFTSINDNMFLSEDYDYFEEFFNNGSSNITSKEGDIFISKRSLYSKLYNIGDNTFKTFFKGNNWIFKSNEDLSGYKFGVVVSTRPECTPPNQNLIEHCTVDPLTEDCVKSGIFPALANAITDLISSNKNINFKVSVIEPESLSFIPGVGKAKPANGTLFDNNAFFGELKKGLDLWVDVFNKAFSKENDWSYDLKVTFSRETEIFPYPITTNVIPGTDKDAYGIGDIRIGFADLGNNDIAKTFYITEEADGTYLQYLTPTIILNSKVFFRRDVDTQHKDAYSLVYVIAHELGHVFGLGHNSRQTSIMNPTIKKSYNLSKLDYLSTKDCLEVIYGKVTDYIFVNDPLVNPPVEVPACNTERIRKNDEFKFLINNKYKTITLKAYVDIPNYMSLDSKKGLIDLYLDKSLKRYIKDNSVYSLNGVDLKIPDINLSLEGIEDYKDVVYAELSDPTFVQLNELSLGIAPNKSAYRIAGNRNFMFDYYSVDTENSKYKLTNYYDDEGNIFRPLLAAIGDGVDSTININLPILTSGDWAELNFYKLGGGDSIISGSYKLSLDYVIDILNDIKQYTKDGEVRLFNSTFDRIRELEVYNPMTINENGEKNNIYNPKKIYRHDAKYDPAVTNVLNHHLREDYNLSSFYNIDFYRLNTLFLLGSEHFGSFQQLTRRVTIDPLNEPYNTQFNIDRNNILFSLEDFIYKGALEDDTFTLYSNEEISETVSGFQDPLLFKKHLNSVLVKVEDEISIKVSEDFVTWSLDKNKLSLTVDKDKVLLDYLYKKMTNYYSLIYNIDMTLYKESLEKFILNNFISLYTISDIYIIRTNSNKGTTYKDQDGLEDRLLYKEGGKVLKIEKDISVDIDFILKIKWKR